MEAAECGAVALGIVLEYHGKVVSLEELRRDCAVSRDGTTAANIVLAARKHGLETKAWKKGLEALRSTPLPCIAFWRFDHFVVLEQMLPDGGARINDPARGRHAIAAAELDQCYTGLCLTLAPGPDFVRGGQRTDLVAAIKKRLEGTGGALALCLFAELGLTLAGLASPAVRQVFLDQVVIERRADWLRPTLWCLAAALLLETALTQAQLAHLRRLKARVAFSMGCDFLWHALRLPATFYARRHPAEVAQRGGILRRVAGSLSGQLAKSVIGGIMLVVIAGVMLFADPVLAMIALASIVVNLAVVRWVTERRLVQTLRAGYERGKLAALQVGGLQTIEALKAQALEGTFFKRWAGTQARVVNHEQAAARGAQTLTLAPDFLAAITSMALVILGGLRVVSGSLSLGGLFAFQQLLSRLQAPVVTLAALGDTVQTLRSDIARVDDVLEHPQDPEVAVRPYTGAKTDPLEGGGHHPGGTVG
jgi:ATP-binding cassette subfamily C protein